MGQPPIIKGILLITKVFRYRDREYSFVFHEPEVSQQDSLLQDGLRLATTFSWYESFQRVWEAQDHADKLIYDPARMCS